MKRSIFILFGAILLTHHASAQYAIGEGAVRDLYQVHCASCHGENLEGGTGGPLIDDDWKYGASDAAIAKVIAEGLPDAGMEAYGEVLSDDEIRSLVIFIREQNQIADRDELLKRTTPRSGVYSTKRRDFILEPVVQADGIIWGMDFLPDGSMIYVLRKGEVYWLREDGIVGPIQGTPEVWEFGQGGLMEVAIDPGYESNGWIYLGYSEPADSDSSEGMTAIARGRIKGDRWVDHEMLFAADDKHHTSRRHHLGTRIVFRDEIGRAHV